VLLHPSQIPHTLACNWIGVIAVKDRHLNRMSNDIDAQASTAWATTLLSMPLFSGKGLVPRVQSGESVNWPPINTFFIFLFIYNLNQQSEFTFYNLMLWLLQCLDGESSSGESPVPQIRSKSLIYKHVDCCPGRRPGFDPMSKRMWFMTRKVILWRPVNCNSTYCAIVINHPVIDSI
jgi:hypothetical protein